MLFFERENLRDKHDDEDENKEENPLSDLVEKYGCHTEEEGQRIDEVADEALGHAHIEEAIVEVVDAIPGEGTFFIVEPHEYDIEGVDEVHSEDGCHRRDLSSGDDSKSRNHERYEHGSRFSEEDVRSDIVEPAPKQGRDENRETEEYEDGIGLRRGGSIDEIELDCEHEHNKQGDKREPRSEARNPVRPIDGVENKDVPYYREQKGYQVDLNTSEDDVVLIKVENSSKYIGNVTDLDARDPDDGPYSDLHRKPKLRWDDKRCISTHLPELFRGFFDITLALPVELVDSVEIIHEAHERYDPPKHEDDKKPLRIYFGEKRREKERKDEEICIEDASDSKRNGFPFMSIGCWVIEESESLEKVFPGMKEEKRGNKRGSKKESKLYKEGEV